MPDSTTILAIECACGSSSVALWQNGNILGLLEDPAAHSQSARIMPMVQQLLAEQRATYADLTHIACTVGPGSFTGIRVGLAAANGICFAAKKPGIGITTLEVTAYAAKDKASNILAVLRAGKGEWYYQPFTSDGKFQETAPANVAPPAAIIASAPKDTVFAGNVVHEDITVFSSQPRADWLAIRAAEKKEALRLAPLYIRAPDVTLPKKKV